jgi:hypothetical protein
LLTKVRRTRRARIALVLMAAFAFAAPTAASAATTSPSLYEVYDLTGYEVWYAPTTGTFVGVGSGAAGEISAWYTAVEHDAVIIPTGSVNGGTSVLQRADGVQMTGRFSGGTVWQSNDGPGCSNDEFQITGTVADVTRTDRPGDTGVGFFTATLKHYRAWIFNDCYSYSAKVTGTFSILF